MQFDRLTETLVQLDSQTGKVEINLEKVVSLDSTILHEKEYKTAKIIVKFMIILAVILFVINFSSNYTEKKVPESEVSLVEYRPGHQDYQIQPGGYGTSIYPVHVGQDGSYYYSKNTPVFAFFLIISFVLILSSRMFYVSKIKTNKKYFEDDNHMITLYLGNSISKSFYVGNMEKTREIFSSIKENYERLKMK